MLDRAQRQGHVRRNGGMAPRIVNLCTRYRWTISFTPQPLYLEIKSPSYSLDNETGMEYKYLEFSYVKIQDVSRREVYIVCYVSSYFLSATK
jgi:hypothetical protein